MKQLIYADNAATTKLDIEAFEAMKPFLLEEYGNASQPYLFARSARKAIKQARETIANCIGAFPEEIFFTSGGTESNNWVIKSVALGDPEKRTIITSQIEHHSVLNTCSAIEHFGYPIIYLPVTNKGEVLPETLENSITDNARLVSIMFSNNEIGSIQPIKELVRIAHNHNALFHTDAVQAVGHLKLDVHELGVDFLSASAHKFNGPKGVGFLFIRKGINVYPYLDGGAQESGFRAGTENVAGIVGMATALQKNCSEISKNQLYLQQLERALIDNLSPIKNFFLQNGSNNRTPGNISLSFKNISGEMLLHRLDLMGIYVSTGSACKSGSTETSHVIKAIGLHQDYADGTIRISFSPSNTFDEAVRIANAIKRIIL